MAVLFLGYFQAKPPLMMVVDWFARYYHERFWRHKILAVPVPVPGTSVNIRPRTKFPVKATHKGVAGSQC